MIIPALQTAATVVALLTSPGVASPQPVSAAASPQVHARFEFEYAREASYASVTPQHQQEITAITNQFNKGEMPAYDAAARINAILTPSEAVAVYQVQTSFWSALRAVFPAGEEVHETMLDPGTFLLMLLYSPAEASANAR